MESLKKPSQTFHEVCGYWLISREGFKANADDSQTRDITSAVIALRLIEELSLFRV
jgi:hypothetical protein